MFHSIKKTDRGKFAFLPKLKLWVSSEHDFMNSDTNIYLMGLVVFLVLIIASLVVVTSNLVNDIAADYLLCEQKAEEARMAYLNEKARADNIGEQSDDLEERYINILEDNDG